ncbi:hypothetical protein [Nitrosomonas sp.]|uniref:hypothetical protein n=1 Tax=Nitrosomonas sp. TaxID=42353 RepID=UPI00272F00AA|nr:hypothetical protein [Nitrosomonas sp.]MDP2222830.1 hypothetical protein [Nitrosomonas sp.]
MNNAICHFDHSEEALIVNAIDFSLLLEMTLVQGFFSPGMAKEISAFITEGDYGSPVISTEWRNLMVKIPHLRSE